MVSRFPDPQMSFFDECHLTTHQKILKNTERSFKKVYSYSSGPNYRVHTPIYSEKKIPAHMALLGTTRLLILNQKF